MFWRSAAREGREPFVSLYPKKGAPWRRVVRTVQIAHREFYDELECGHKETHDVLSKKRRCRTCADPSFPGISLEPRTPEPPVVSAEVASEGVPAPMPPPATSPSIPLVLTVEEVADLLRVNRKTVYEAAARGEIPGVRRIGHTLRFYGPALVKWLENGTGTKARKASRR
jgi:excisionase family DNA binding protein